MKEEIGKGRRNEKKESEKKKEKKKLETNFDPTHRVCNL